MWKVPSCCKEEVLTRHIKERVKQKENRKQREDIRVQSFRNEKHDNVFFDASVCKLTTSGGIFAHTECNLLQIMYDLLQL